MVFSGNRTGDRQRRPAAEEEEEEMDRLKPPLHNFDLPCLKWGNQKFLRCMKVDSNGEIDRKRKLSPESGGGGVGSGYGGVVIGARRRDVDVQRRFRSSDYKFSSSEKLKSKFNSKSIAGDGEIEATREKLMLDLQTEVGKMKDAMLRRSFPDPSPVTVTVTAPVPASETDRPWNLRTRRAACKAPSSSNGVNGNGDDLKPNPIYSPVRNTEFEKSTERPKFSVSLSRREVEEDFMAMSGRRLPRKPKKRPKAIQKQLDTLFPGLWLTEITPDLYRVPDDIESGKR